MFFMDGTRKIFGRKKIMDNKIDVEKLSSLELVNNKKLNDAIILLNEMYCHMAERTGIPNFDPESGSTWGAEGGFSMFISLNFRPFEQHRYMLSSYPDVVSVIINTELLARRDQDMNLQNFDSVEKFYNQVKNWHSFEMALPMEDKNAYHYINPNK